MFKLESNQNIVSDTIDAALSHDHRDHLLSDGLTESHIYLLVKDYGVRSIGEIEARELGFVVADEKRKNTKGTVSSSGIYFPFRGEFGQLRCDNPPIIKGKRRKYLSPIGQQSQAWLPDSANVVTEGFKDAAAGTFHGRIATGAIAGVSHYRKALPQKGGHTLLFDSDGWTNPSVFAALVSAAAWTGGKIQLIPEIEGQPKAGLCEYFKAGHTAADYQTLIAGAMSIGEFLLELPNRWGNMPTKYLARALRTIAVLGARHLASTELAILETRLKRFGKIHEIPASEVTRSLKVAKSAAQSDQSANEKRSAADQLIDIGRGNGISYFKTSEGIVYADLSHENKRQTVALRSKDFRQYLRSELFDKTGRSPGSEAVQQAIDTLEALTLRNCPQQEVKVRLADHDGKIYLDLADDTWQAIEVDAAGWRMTGDYPVRFRRGGSSPMTKPIEGGRLEDLKELCQFDFDTWVLIVCFLIQCLKPSGQYPVLCLHGAGGAGKSTITKMLKRLIDPSPVLTRSNVGDVRQFAIHATKRHIVAIDNLSGLSAEQSDILCRAATGGGHSERTLHSDDEETNFSFVNPLILNGIDSIATRGDLLSRAFLVTLRAQENRPSEAVFEQRLTDIQPGVFGGLLDLLSQVLAVLPSVEGTYQGTERFVGFVELGLAIEQVLGWESGTVLRVLAGVREEAHETAIESSPVGQAIQELMLGRERWTGSASELLQKLSALAPDKVVRSNYWPSDSTRLSKTLTRLEPDLKALGLELSREKRTGGLRMVTIERIDLATAMPPSNTDAAGELSPGAKVVLTVDGEYSREGLSMGDWVIVEEVRLSGPTPQIPKPIPFAVVSDPKGNKHSIWLSHLKPWNEDDRLGVWESAA
jgi:hypothetical protein